MDVAALPFNRWLGLRTEGDTVRLTPTADHTNHLNTVHAAVVFSIAEAAAGHWLATQYPELEQDYIAVLRNSSTKYRSPPPVMQNLWERLRLPRAATIF